MLRFFYLEICESQMPTLNQLLNENSEATFVIALGTNSLLSSVADHSYKQFANALSASDQECVWIGPPHFNESQSKGFPTGRVATLNNNLNSFYNSFSAAVANTCKVIDSRSATASSTAGYDTSDGVHRTPSAGRYWANEVSKDVLKAK